MSIYSKMKIFNVDIPDNPLEWLQGQKIEEKGKWELSLTNPPPENNLDVAETALYLNLKEEIKQKLYYSVPEDSPLKYSNSMGYPPGGGMSWHTNGDYPGARIYASWSETGDSGMLFYRDGKIIVDKDVKGLNMRYFLAPSWHGVWSNCYRLSIGFRTK